MKLAIIGTSHVAKILSAQRSHFPELSSQWDCYPVPNGLNDGKGLSAVTLDKQSGRLINFPGRKGASRSVSVRDYDGFVLVGGQPSAVAHAQLMNRELSVAFRAAAIDDLMTRNNNVRLFDIIRSLNAAPVMVATCLLHSRGAHPPAELIERAEAGIAAYWRGRGAIFLPQPRETVGDDLITRKDCQMGGGDNHLTTDAAAHVVRQIRDTLPELAGA